MLVYNKRTRPATAAAVALAGPYKRYLEPCGWRTHKSASLLADVLNLRKQRTKQRGRQWQRLFFELADFLNHQENQPIGHMLDKRQKEVIHNARHIFLNALEHLF